MKKNYLEDLNEIQAMVGSIRSINEAISFADNYEDTQEAPQQAPEPQAQDAQQPMNPQAEGGAVPAETEQSAEDQEMASELEDDNSPINTIREIALKGMVRLCKTPEDPQYEVLKKIFTFCDKANDKKNEGTNA